MPSTVKRHSVAVMFTDIADSTHIMANDAVKDKFLRYPIPKAIVEEWEKLQ